ncbi:MAG: nucleotide pyrophosphohydrolase [Ponticaulis sp.]|nr:nucleotide pyrophosphohydrolase [Ponticaulis sp.]|tara:strand:- start:3148 stop:3441 length:294 start_codon:yes stop_codon:yes gene_type:complete
MIETSQTIKAWGDETFGKAMDPVKLVERAEVEMAELKEALAAGDLPEAGKEAADVVILLHRLMGDLGKELSAEVDAKMAINRERQWISAGDGTGRHV